MPKKPLRFGLGLGSAPAFALGLILAAGSGCAHERGGTGGAGGGTYADDGCLGEYPSIYASGYSGRAYSRLGVWDSYPCYSYGWEPSVFLQSPESAAPARAEIAARAGRRPHPRVIDRPSDTMGGGFGGRSSDSSPDSSSSAGSSIHLSTPSPSFSAPAPAAPPAPAPAAPPSGRPPN